jgi:2-polyprenyl-3-methyl-5-hydroxy-6-metoxy-1,4-benzoquinol methylase
MSRKSAGNAIRSDMSMANGGVEAYSMKVPSYFSGARADCVAALPYNREARILELGCGEGATGALALSEGKCGAYCGVELCQKAAEKANKKITEVVVGNVEEHMLPWAPKHFDALIMSEVLEHLEDPWATLRRLRPLLKPNALVFASSPNVSHHRVIRMVIKGEWNLADLGVMDRTHLRWFTPKTYSTCSSRVAILSTRSAN